MNNFNFWQKKSICLYYVNYLYKSFYFQLYLEHHYRARNISPKNHETQIETYGVPNMRKTQVSS